MEAAVNEKNASDRYDRLRYHGDMVDHVDAGLRALYDYWFTLATEHALGEGRHTVLKKDAEATLHEALKKLDEKNK